MVAQGLEGAPLAARVDERVVVHGWKGVKHYRPIYSGISDVNNLSYPTCEVLVCLLVLI